MNKKEFRQSIFLALIQSELESDRVLLRFRDLIRLAERLNLEEEEDTESTSIDELRFKAKKIHLKEVGGRKGFNSLLNNGFVTLYDVLRKNREELCSIESVGETTIRDIKRAASQIGIPESMALGFFSDNE